MEEKKIVAHDVIVEANKYIKNKEDLAMIQKALDFSKKMHEGQFRKSGEPYIVHVINVGYILATLHSGPKTIVAGLLHDVLEDCDIPKEDLIAEFDEEIVSLVEAVTKIGNLKFKNEKEYQAANHRKIFIAMAKDIRVIFIKLVDRLHNMRTLQYMPEEKQKRIAAETLEVYAPIAHRLGISKIKNELEDLCFFYLNREEYYHIAHLVESKKVERDAQVKKMIEEISDLLTKNHIEFHIFGRSKHLYSIHKKMVKKHKRFDEILDLLAIRIITKTELNCYEILGYIHAKYRPIPGRLKDYIAMPKMNMYQSLHTTIVGDEGKIFEVQIRTEEMDQIAEGGVAAHWRYKEGRKYDSRSEQKEIEAKLIWLKDFASLTSGDISNDAQELMDTMQRDIFEANVYVMTPQGRVIDLPNGSTPIDFAYRVHTEVGHSCVGALVNDTLVPLNTPLKTGDVVRIRTSKQYSGPSEDWLKIVKTNGAKSKIRSYLMNKEHERKQQRLEEGEKILSDELRKRGFDPKEYMDKKKIEGILSQFQANTYVDLIYSLAVKSNSPQNVVDKLTNVKKSAMNDEELVEKLIHNKANKERKSTGKNGLKVEGIDTMMMSVSGCCCPVFGDEIIGYITKGNGIKVHRTCCPNVQSKERLIEVTWDEETNVGNYTSNIEVLAKDRNFLMTDIVTVASQCKGSIMKINSTLNSEELTVTCRLSIKVKDLEHLESIIANLRKIDNVVTVNREIL